MGIDMQTINEEKNSFGARLRAERERQGLTQEHFGSLGGVTRLTQSKYESGESSPNVDYLMKIEPYGVDLHFLLNCDIEDAPIFSSKNLIIDNSELVGLIVEVLETAILEKGVQLSPAKKAQIVATICRNSRVNLPVDTRLVSDLLSLATA
ncbi:MAG: hypothetical protein CO070_08265 [Gallionellales bacterium CG_4_9_14_0_8_um_filter_55_61]|nr:MAG: hypothetical protein COW64_15840 [bacterium (Candidatus Blackallbacteria) CG18_big_fil_WC_8_21_14_2_50_49_26]PJC03393.1 MAG: hypothetical protein CO070_08265 [Gallionellales bacterium CG_4_9_14_0_8_um_filter_55_61]